MRIRRCPYWLLAAIWVAMLGPGGQMLFAQDSIPQDTLQAKTELDDPAKVAIDAFLDEQVRRLQTDDPNEVAQGRARIVEYFNLSNSDFFKVYYAQALAGRVVPLIDADSPLMTRLNVAIISSKLTGKDLVTVLQAGASDPSPAVRYWIAKAVGNAAKKDAFDKQQQQDVLVVLAGRLKAEDASLVLEQIMLAIAEIDLPDAIKTVLEGLDSRVAFHKNNPDARFKPVLNGMQQLWSKLIALRSGGSNVNKDLNDLGRIAYRYYALIADQMPAFDDADDPGAVVVKKDKALMAQICARVMDYAVRDVAGLAAPQPVDTNNATELKASAARWRDILKGPPFSFTDEELTVAEE